MPFYFYVWNEANIDYLAQHDVTRDEFEEVVGDPDSTEQSHSSDRHIAMGMTSTGRFLCCVYELIDETTIYPFTAFEIDR